MYVAFKSKRKSYASATNIETLCKDCIQNYIQRYLAGWYANSSHLCSLPSTHVDSVKPSIHVFRELWMPSLAHMVHICAFRLLSRNYLAIYMVWAKVFVLKHIKLQDFLWVKLHFALAKYVCIYMYKFVVYGVGFVNQCHRASSDWIKSKHFLGFHDNAELTDKTARTASMEIKFKSPWKLYVIWKNHMWHGNSGD